jgi:hypothetical protein
MKRRTGILIASIIVIMIIIGWAFFYRGNPVASNLEVLVTSHLTLETQWCELRPTSVLRTTGEWSELLIEMPELNLDQMGGEIKLIDGNELYVEGYLTESTGEKIYLSKINAIGVRNEKFLRLSSSNLEWKKKDYQFHSIVLRSNIRIDAGRVLWISYDPRSFKDGVFFPKEK